MLTRAALKNPDAVFAICMIMLALGRVSYQKMRVDIFPEIKIPTILVTTFYRVHNRTGVVWPRENVFQLA